VDPPHPGNLPRTHKISRYPLRKPPRGGIPLPRVLLAPRRASAGTSETTAPPVFPLVSPSPSAQSQATILPLVPIKAPPKSPELVAPNINSGEQSPVRGRTNPPPHCPNQPSHHLLHLTKKLYSRSPRHLPHRTATTTIRTRRRLCATVGKPPRSTPSPPKVSNRCSWFPSCIYHLRPSPSATLVSGIWSAVAVPLCKGPICFDFNLSEKLSVNLRDSFVNLKLEL
jgi:hypothetical protein